MVTALIVDDEPLARHRLRELIRDVDWMTCVGEAADGNAARDAIDALRPDLAFLDIQMPGIPGIDVLRHTRHAPAVIFTTAYDRYAVTAFELAALDYLLKPFGRERFRHALDRVRAAIEKTPDPFPSGHSPASLSAVERALATLPPGSARRLFVRDGGRIVPLKLSSVERVEACDDFVLVHAGGRRYRMNVALQDLEQRLDPGVFVRVHRSHIVNLDHVVGWEPYDGSRFRVRLRDGSSLTASRERSRLLRHLSR